MALLAGCAVLSACVPSNAQTPQPEIRYESIDRTAYYSFSAGHGMHGEVPALNPTAEQKQAFSESLGYPLHDCSTPRYRCLRTWFRVFAIPAGHTSRGMTYSVAGTQLKVESCLRGPDIACQVALISADCQVMQTEDACELYAGGREKSPRPGPITYFIYSEDYGVTAFGTGGAWPESADERVAVAERVAAQYVLQGQVGLLKAATPTAQAAVER